ncbi:hypothetical protein GCK32_015642 [Trichostrongylus colubriformis]|uniref:Uncharacterized protein n=1 Tax=Trichostrongylus colubriformis TaxID=6319 RepID=A0AAN8EX28_TRICO
MFILFAVLGTFLITVHTQYYSRYYFPPAYYSWSPYGYSQYPSYGYNQYPQDYQQYQQYSYSRAAMPLLGPLFGGRYNVDQYGNAYLGTPGVGLFLTCNGKGCAARG